MFFTSWQLYFSLVQVGETRKSDGCCGNPCRRRTRGRGGVLAPGQTAGWYGMSWNKAHESDAEISFVLFQPDGLSATRTLNAGSCNLRQSSTTQDFANRNSVLRSVVKK